MTEMLVRITFNTREGVEPATPEQIIKEADAQFPFIDFELVPFLHETVSAEDATKEKGYPHPGSVIQLPNLGGTIHLQYGHPAIVDRNGCFTTDVIQGLVDNISVYQKRGHPMSTRETAVAITKLEEALMWINYRKHKRAERGVHQTDKP